MTVLSYSIGAAVDPGLVYRVRWSGVPSWAGVCASVRSSAMRIHRTIASHARMSLRLRAAALVSGSGGGMGRRAVLGALVAVLVLGILGMHALASHGALANADSSGVTRTIAVEGRLARGGVDGRADDWFRATALQVRNAGVQDGATLGHAFGRPLTQDQGPGHDSDGGMSMLMLCAVILAAVLTFVVLGCVGMFRLRWPAAFWPAGARDVITRWPLSTGPPHVWQFSVIRC